MGMGQDERAVVIGAMAICVLPRPLTPDPSPKKGERGEQSPGARSPVTGRGGPGEDSTHPNRLIRVLCHLVWCCGGT